MTSWGGARGAGPPPPRPPGGISAAAPLLIHNATLDIQAYAEKLLHRSLRTAVEHHKHSGLYHVCRLLTGQKETLTKPLEVSQTMKMSAEEIEQILKEGELEKRSDNLLQFWKRKTCVLTTDSLNIYGDAQKRTKSKELKLQAIRKVDCVERTGKFVYFTIVTTDNKEIDFRCCSEDHCWNACRCGT
ncbi:hypothetical protein CRUP_013626 [Coryphaenoides rupestris]|nr:hypothetical protein CRUP_013626 [Coryphaenoides rupestris]